MAKKDKKEYLEDDGRTIADMGMFREKESQPFLIPRFDRLRKKKKIKSSQAQSIDLTKEEEKAIIRGVRRAIFLGGLGLFGILALFLFFCQLVWFR